MVCYGPCQGKTKEEQESLTFNPDCPKCMEIWAKFLEQKNIYAVTDKNVHEYCKILKCSISAHTPIFNKLSWDSWFFLP